MSNLSPEQFYRRNLPHIQPPGATFFITCRLTGSIPRQVLLQLHEEFEAIQSELERMPDSPERNKRFYREKLLFFGKWDAALAAGTGSDYLRNPAVAHLVADSIHNFDNQRYRLICYCIMPNHIHFLLRPMPKAEMDYYSLAQINHSLKGYTAVKANKLLDRSGKFWQHESFDHFARNEAESQRIVSYILNNPVKAGLVKEWREWPFSYCKNDLLS